MYKIDADFVDAVSHSDEFNANACMHCGNCTASCPMGLELLPRKLFRYVVVGLEKMVVENVETIYSCLLCKMCEESCPADVHIAGNIKKLRNYINTKYYKL